MRHPLSHPPARSKRRLWGRCIAIRSTTSYCDHRFPSGSRARPCSIPICAIAPRRPSTSVDSIRTKSKATQRSRFPDFSQAALVNEIARDSRRPLLENSPAFQGWDRNIAPNRVPLGRQNLSFVLTDWFLFITLHPALKRWAIVKTAFVLTLTLILSALHPVAIPGRMRRSAR
jgi:hypothetical protein